MPCEYAFIVVRYPLLQGAFLFISGKWVKDRGLRQSSNVLNNVVCSFLLELHCLGLLWRVI